MSTNKTEPIYTATFEEVVVTAKGLKKDDVLFLAKIIHSEGSVSKEDYLAIAHTVIVRMKAKNKSLRQICTKDQYNGLNTRKYHQHPPIEAVEAAKQALLGNTMDIYPYNLYYFHNPKTATNKKWVNYITQYKWKEIGDHVFCLNHKM